MSRQTKGYLKRKLKAVYKRYDELTIQVQSLEELYKRSTGKDFDPEDEDLDKGMTKEKKYLVKSLCDALYKLEDLDCERVMLDSMYRKLTGQEYDPDEDERLKELARMEKEEEKEARKARKGRSRNKHWRKDRASRLERVKMYLGEEGEEF